MKSHVSSRVRGLLGDEVLGAVLAAERHAGLDEHPDLLERDVLRRREHLDALAHLGAHGGEVRAHDVGLQPGDQLRHATPAWRPVRSPSRRCEKNSRGSQNVQSPQSSIAPHPGRLQLVAGR